MDASAKADLARYLERQAGGWRDAVRIMADALARWFRGEVGADNGRQSAHKPAHGENGAEPSP